MSAPEHPSDAPDASAGATTATPRWRGALQRLPDLVDQLRLLWRASPGWTSAQIALHVAQGLVPAALLALLEPFFDAIGTEAGTPLLWVGGIGALLLLGALLRAVSTVVDQAQAELLADHVQERIHVQSVALDLAHLESPRYHDALHRAQREGAFRPQRIATGMASVLRNLVVLVGVAALLVASQPWLMLVVLLFSVPGFLARLRSAEALYLWRRRSTESERRVLAIREMLTQLAYAKELRLLGLGRLLRGRHREARRVLRDERLALARRRARAEIATQLGGTLAIVGALVAVTVEASRGHISLGGLVLLFGGLQRVLSSSQQLLVSLGGLYEDGRFAGELRAFLALEPGIREPAAPVSTYSAPETGLRVEGVRFRYPGEEREVLRGVDLMLRPGEVVALVGENGAGKTTLVKLLCRLYDPDVGTLRLHGTDLRELGLQELRRRISVVFEDFARFPATVRENVAWGDVFRSPLSDAALSRAADQAGATELIERLPGGWQAELGRWFETGHELSAGEWRRLALARAFVRESAELVILDEPTSGLDALAEAELFSRFRELMGGRTALVISHRFSTVRTADRILVLANGRIEESGSHDALMREGGRYARLFEAQASRYRD